MCFIIDKNHPKEKTAEKDIIAYKIVSKKQYLNSTIAENEFSPYFKKHLTYKLEKKNPKIKKLVVLPDDIEPRIDKIIREGYHSYTTKDRLFCLSTYLTHNISVKCVIPKGSKYYYNEENEEYVSNQIIIKKVIEWNELINHGISM